jgi:hypothetical protein
MTKLLEKTETINGESCQIISTEHVQVIGRLPDKLFVEELDMAASPSEEIQVTPRSAEMLSSTSARVTYAPNIDKEENYFSADTALSPPPMFSDNLATSADNFALSNLPKRTNTSTTLDDVDGNSSSSDVPSSLGRSDSAYSDHITFDHVIMARPLLQPVLAEETEFMLASSRSRSASIAENSETVYYMPARTVTVTQDAQTTLRHTSSSSSSSSSESDNEESSGKMLGLLPPVLFADDDAPVVEHVEIEHSLEGRYFRQLRRETVCMENVVRFQNLFPSIRDGVKAVLRYRGLKPRDDIMLDHTHGTDKVTSKIQDEEVVVLEGKLMNEITTTRDLDSDYQIHEEESVQLYQKQEVSAVIQPTYSSAVNHRRASVASRDSVTNEHVEYIADDKVFNNVAGKAPARRKKLLKKRKVSQDLSKQQTQQSSYRRARDTSGSSSSSDSDVARAKKRPSSVSDDVILLYQLAEQRGMKWEVIDQLHKTKPAPAVEHVERDTVVLTTAAAATTASMLGSVANHEADEIDNATVIIEEQNTDILNAKVIVIRQQTSEVPPALLREETVEQLESRTFAQTDDCVKYVVATEMAAISAEHLQPDAELAAEPEPKPVVVVTIVDILEGRCAVQTETTVNDLAEKVAVGAVTVATAEDVHIPEVEAASIQMTVIDDLEARSVVQTETCVDELPGKTTVAMETLESVSSDVEPVVTTLVIVDDLEGRTVVQEDTCVDDLPDKLLLASAVTLAAASPLSDEGDSYTYDTSSTPIVTVVDDLQERTIAQTEYTVEDLPDKLGAGAVIMRADLNMENEDEDGVDADNVVVAGAAGLAVYHNELIHISDEEVIEGESDVFFTREEEEAAAAEMLMHQEELERYFSKLTLRCPNIRFWWHTQSFVCVFVSFFSLEFCAAVHTPCLLNNKLFTTSHNIKQCVCQ